MKYNDFNDAKARCINEVYKAEKNCSIQVNQKANSFVCSSCCATYTNTNKKEMFLLKKGDILYSSEKEVEILKVVNVKDSNNE